jgi:hypothetical protein
MVCGLRATTTNDKLVLPTSMQTADATTPFEAETLEQANAATDTVERGSTSYVGGAGAF